MPQTTSEGRRERKFPWLIAIAMVLVAAIVIVSILRDRIVNQPQWQVNVSGQGRVQYQPDIALVNLGVQVDKAATAQDALTSLNSAMDKIIPALKASGVSESDIQTQNYSLMPQYDYRDNVTTLSGYSANQQLAVKVRNFKDQPDRVSTVIGEASKNGANQVLGISFDVSNIDELKQQARLLAMQDAKKKATSQAKATGVRLGEIIGWWENMVQAPGMPTPYYYDGKGGMGGGNVTPQIPSATQEIVVEMSLNYRIR